MRSFDPPSPMPVMPMSVSTVTSIALWLKLRFMLGCSQHFTRVTFAPGSAASARAGRMSPAPTPAAPAAIDLNSDRRFIMGASPLERCSGGAFYANTGRSRAGRGDARIRCRFSFPLAHMDVQQSAMSLLGWCQWLEHTSLAVAIAESTLRFPLIEDTHILSSPLSGG